MKTIRAIAGYTFKQHLRHRVYWTVGLFGLVLLGGSAVVSALAVEEQTRMMIDLGLAGIELLALLAVVFVTVSLVLEEVESRAITLILTRPVRRSEYLLGRYAGTLLSISLGMVAMAVLHVGVMALVGWWPQSFYAMALLCSLGKVMVVGSLALLLSLFSTSSASSMTFTIFFWILGHFSEELRFMGEKSDSGFVKAFIWFTAEITPDFSYYNYRDFWMAASLPPPSWFGWMVVYTFSYIGVCLFLSNFLFSQKEF